VSVEWWSVHRLVACAAGPSRVAAAVTEAGLVTDMDLAGAECVSVWPARRRVGDPLAVGRLHQIAKHNLSLGRDGSRPCELSAVPEPMIYL